MANPAFELTDFSEPIYLDYQHLKFWEISLNEYSFGTFVRCGKFTHSHKEDTKSVQSASKTHKNLGEAIAYVEKHVNVKLSKGYTISKKPSEEIQPAAKEASRSAEYSINILSEPSQKNGLKKREGDDVLEREDLKQVKKTNKNEDSEMMLADKTIEAAKEIEKGKMEVEKEKEKVLASPNYSASLKSPQSESMISGVSSPRKVKYRYYTNCNDSDDEDTARPVNLGSLEVPNTGYNSRPPTKNYEQSYNNNQNKTQSYNKSAAYSSKAPEKSSPYASKAQERSFPTSPKASSPSNSKAYERSPDRGNTAEGPLGKPVQTPYKVLLGASTWENEDPTGWYMSEKLDGMRCFWDGRQLLTSSGNVNAAPGFFTKDFPKSALDGELWTGRSTFAQQRCASIVRRKQPVDSEWKQVRFMVFDCPEVSLPFKERYEKLKDVIAKIKSPYLQVVEHKVCKGVDDLYQELINIKEGGGEGLMIRDPKSFYEKKAKSKTLLEIRTLDDN